MAELIWSLDFARQESEEVSIFNSMGFGLSKKINEYSKGKIDGEKVES